MNIPNQISLLRLCLMPALLFLAWQGQAHWFLGLLIIAFITDILDGFLARVLNQRSALGAKLDTTADAIIYLTMTLAAWLLWPALFTQEAPYILLVICSSLTLGIIGLLKFKTFTSYHTWLIKFSIALMAVAYILFFSGGPAWLFRLACIFCFLGTLEEILITFILKTPKSNVISLWHLYQQMRTPKSANCRSTQR